MTMQQSALFLDVTKKTAGDPSRAQKLRQMADKLDSRIEQKRNTHRGANLTWKRQKEIEAANTEADAMEEQQVLMRALADLWESGKVPAHLQQLKHGTQFSDIVSDVSRLRRGYTVNGLLEIAEWAQGVLDGAQNGDRDRQRQIDRLVAEVRLAKIPGFFPTPSEVSDQMLSHTYLDPGTRVLEPQAGDGQLADAIQTCFPGVAITCVEWNHKLRSILELKGYPVLEQDDFLEVTQDGWDAIIMNPPFEKMADVDHVMHAYKLVKAGGYLISVVSESPFFNSNQKGKDFRAWLDMVGGEAYDLPAGAFKESGTGVKARFIVVRK